jgi:hypothetical protein
MINLTRRLPLITLSILTFTISAYSAPSALYEASSPENLMPKGQWYEANVPDTLDLAERAKLSVHVLTSNVDPNVFYAVYQVYNILTAPDKPAGLTWNITSKNARTLPLMRVMCGSSENLKIESEMMRALLSQVAEDGLMYHPYGGEGVPSDSVYPVVQGAMALGILNWYQRDGNPEWLTCYEKMCAGLRKCVIQIENRAYYPPECGYQRDGTWKWTTRGAATIPYTPPAEPNLDQQGLEGAVKWEQAHPMRVLANDYKMNGNKDSLDVALRLSRFCLKPQMWEEGFVKGYPGFEHGLFAGHFHGNITALHALLELGIITGDPQLIETAQEGYQHARNNGVVHLGWFPSWLRGDKYHRGSGFHNINETCGTTDLLMLAVKLSDAGLGDYWEDVDYIVRNHYTEMQICDLDRMRKVAGVSPGNDAVLKRFAGGFCDAEPTGLRRGINGCCSANGALGLYYAWHGIIRFDNDVAVVNLLLNRVSDALDIDSFLPYEGKVILYNKKAQTVMVRIPSWIDKSQLKCFVGNKPVRFAKTGAYIVIGDLKAKDKIILEFPVPEFTERYTIADTLYTVKFRGSTVIDISPRLPENQVYPFFMREKFKELKAPLHKVQRFVSDKIIPLQ